MGDEGLNKDAAGKATTGDTSGAMEDEKSSSKSADKCRVGQRKGWKDSMGLSKPDAPGAADGDVPAALGAALNSVVSRRSSRACRSKAKDSGYDDAEDAFIDDAEVSVRDKPAARQQQRGKRKSAGAGVGKKDAEHKGGGGGGEKEAADLAGLEEMDEATRSAVLALIAQDK